MFVIPKSTLYVLKLDTQGAAVFALQRSMNKLGITTDEDADFGPQTAANAKKLQTKLGLTADGIVGSVTQTALAKYLCARQEAINTLPKDLLLSKITYESSCYLGAVSWTSPGGVDCGITQRRVYEGDYITEDVVKRAFDPPYQVDLSGDRVSELYDIFYTNATRLYTKGHRVLSYRVAVLNHNYPSLADRVSKVGITGLSSYYTSPQDWVIGNGLEFPDGADIRTPLEWGQHYALGASSHNEPGQAVKLVTNWG